MCMRNSNASATELVSIATFSHDFPIAFAPCRLDAILRHSPAGAASDALNLGRLYEIQAIPAPKAGFETEFEF